VLEVLRKKVPGKLRRLPDDEAAAAEGQATARQACPARCMRWRGRARGCWGLPLALSPPGDDAVGAVIVYDVVAARRSPRELRL
jgi:hypothetical protein